MIEKSTKNLKNITNNSIFIEDVGISLDGYDAIYNIPPQDYQYWAASDDIESYLISGDVVASDEHSELDGYLGIALLRDGIARQIAFDLSGYFPNMAFPPTDINLQKAIETARLFGVDEDGYRVADAYEIDFKKGFNVTSDGYKAIIELEIPADVSPGFTWGDSGANKNTYLLNDTVPSNKAGRVVPSDGVITEVTISLENIAAAGATVEIQSRVGTTFTPLVIVSLSTISRITIVPVSVLVDAGTELACFAGNKSLFNPVVAVAVSAR